MLEIRLKPYQDKYIFSQSRFPALISGIGTGKTLCLISRMMNLMETYPNNLGIIIRKEFTDLRDSTIKDFERYTGLTVGSNKDCRLPNGSLIMFRHGDEINVLKNINAGAIAIEQAEEFDNDETFTFLRDRLRRKEAGLRSLFIIANANGHNWIFNQWKVNPDRDKEFELIEASTFDNADNLPVDYIEDLKKMEITHPEHYRRYVLNSWDDVDTVDQIIRPEWVDKALTRNINFTSVRSRVVSIDVARYGDDKTPFRLIESANRQYKVTARQDIEKKSTMEVVGYAVLFGEKHSCNNYAVDEIGVGAGVADRLKELGKNVIFVNSARVSSNPIKWKNLRSEMHCKAAEKFEQDRVQLMADDPDAVEQLSWARYKAIKSNGLLQVEAKEDIKKRFGKSPDVSDVIVNGLWAVDQVEAEQVYQKEVESREDVKGWRSLRR